MNNTTTTKRNLTAIAAVFMAAVLVVGGTLVTAAYASNNNSGNTVTAQINKQKASQSGFDNVQEQEAQNTICTHPESDASCVSENAAAAAVVPTKLTCEQCFMKFLTPGQISDVIDNLKIKDVTTLADLCAFLQGNITDEETLLLAAINAGIPLTTAKELTQCLKDAGIVFTT